MASKKGGQTKSGLGFSTQNKGLMLCTRAQSHASTEEITLMDGHGPSTNGTAGRTISIRRGRFPAAGPDPGQPKPALSHIDFWPSCHPRALKTSSNPAHDKACDCTFEHFDVLIERGNRWLQQFPDYELVNCETADKKVYLVQDIYSASMLYQDDDSVATMATHIKGLRLWYRQRKRINTAPPTQPIIMGYSDFVPKYLNRGEKHPKFETLNDVIEQLNGKLRQFPLPGSVLNVETIELKISENEWSMTYLVDSSVCQCYDDYFTHQISYIRVFYKLGEPSHELVGVHDFTPDILDEGGLFSPAQYSPFSSLIDKARAWISSSRGLKITNLQTLETKHRKKSENHGHRFNTEKMFEYKIEDRFRAYFVRVGYTRPDDVTAQVSCPIPDIACRTYRPLAKRRGTYENITEVLERVAACLNATNANPFHVETVPIPEWMTRSEFAEKGERTFFDGEWYFQSDKDGNPHGPLRHPIIYVIRVYFNGQFEDPPFMRTQSVQVPDDSCCMIM